VDGIGQGRAALPSDPVPSDRLRRTGARADQGESVPDPDRGGIPETRTRPRRSRRGSETSYCVRLQYGESVGGKAEVVENKNITVDPYQTLYAVLPIFRCFFSVSSPRKQQLGAGPLEFLLTALRLKCYFIRPLIQAKPASSI